ncbi:MAG: hypothetical protein QXE13_06320 [Sulfolobales archaeon]
MVEVRYYYRVGLPLEKLIEFLSDLNNQSVEIERSRITGISRGSESNTWFINLKVGFLMGLKIPVKLEREGNSIIYRSQDGNLLLRYDIYKIDERNTLVEFYIKVIDRLAPLFSPEIPGLDTRFIRSLRSKYTDINVLRISEEVFRDYIDLARRVLTPRREITPEPTPSQTEIKPATPVAKIEEVAKAVPIIGGEIIEEARVKPSKAEVIACSDCILYDENTSYCTVLVKRIEDPSKPPCNGEKFIRRT